MKVSLYAFNFPCEEWFDLVMLVSSWPGSVLSLEVMWKYESFGLPSDYSFLPSEFFVYMNFFVTVSGDLFIVIFYF